MNDRATDLDRSRTLVDRRPGQPERRAALLREKMKSDSSIKNIVAAAIRRASIEPHTWLRTSLWDDGEPALISLLSRRCSFEIDELPILYSFIDVDTWTVFTTRAVWYSNEGNTGIARITPGTIYDFGNFKGLRGEATATMHLTTPDGRVHLCRYETGHPSMGPVYAIMTLCAVTSAA